MSTANVRALVEVFVSQLENEIRKAALAAITATLGGGRAATRSSETAKAEPSRPAKVKKAKKATKAKASKTKTALGKASKRVRRSPADLDRDVGRLVAYVRANNGVTNEKARASLQLSKTEWTSTLAKAVSSKQLATKGEKRSTTLHLSGK